MQHIQVAVAKVQSGALVAVEIQHGRRILTALFFQIVGLGAGRGDRGHKGIDALQRVIQQQTPLCDHVMPAARITAEQFHQIEALADDSLVSVEAVIGKNDQGGFGSHWTLLNRGPYSTHHGVKGTQGHQMRFAIVVVMGNVIESGFVQVQIVNTRIF